MTDSPFIIMFLIGFALLSGCVGWVVRDIQSKIDKPESTFDGPN